MQAKEERQKLIADVGPTIIMMQVGARPSASAIADRDETMVRNNSKNDAEAIPGCCCCQSSFAKHVQLSPNASNIHRRRHARVTGWPCKPCCAHYFAPP
jgi:hypothetical protein